MVAWNDRRAAARMTWRHLVGAASIAISEITQCATHVFDDLHVFDRGLQRFGRCVHGLQRRLTSGLSSGPHPLSGDPARFRRPSRRSSRSARTLSSASRRRSRLSRASSAATLKRSASFLTDSAAMLRSSAEPRSCADSM
jgi:hypothetical protein